jgi:hypothetical protein
MTWHGDEDVFMLRMMHGMIHHDRLHLIIFIFSEVASILTKLPVSHDRQWILSVIPAGNMQFHKQWLYNRGCTNLWYLLLLWLCLFITPFRPPSATIAPTKKIDK